LKLQEVRVVVIKNYNQDYFYKIVKEKYIFSDEGYYIFNGDKWSINCIMPTKKRQLNADSCSKEIFSFLKKYLDNQKTFNSIQDYSTTKINGMCFNHQLISDKHELSLSHSLCVNLSTIIPFFHLHVLELKRKENNFPKWDGLPVRNKDLEEGDYKVHVDSIKDFMISKLCMREFPDSLTNKVVPEIYTEDIRKGSFTYFNAFFQREYYTR